MGSYSVHLKRSAAKEIEALPRKDRARIIERIRTCPRIPSSRFDEAVGSRSLSHSPGDYRIVYTVSDQDRVVMVSVVAHRRDAYR